MNTNAMIDKIAQKDFDAGEFLPAALNDEYARDEMVKQMATNPDIMVYYHCYYVVSKASKQKPELFYGYWEVIANLLGHENSYHRNFALDIIGNLTGVDGDNRFSDIEENYFGLINDVKFTTGHCCVQNLVKIYRHKGGLRDRIVGLLLDIDNQCAYTEKQMALLKYDVLEIFDEIYEDRQEVDRIDEFIRMQVDSTSPKTGKKARELAKKYSL
jgi:hypothetical protein